MCFKPAKTSFLRFKKYFVFSSTSKNIENIFGGSENPLGFSSTCKKSKIF